MAIETNAAILPFGVVLSYVIVLNSPIKTKWFNNNQICDDRFKCIFWFTTTNEADMFPNVSYVVHSA